jgi:hypothetical protein
MSTAPHLRRSLHGRRDGTSRQWDIPRAGESDVWCRITDSDDLRFPPLAGEVMRVLYGPLPNAVAAQSGVAYCEGVIDCYRDAGDERPLR